MALAWRKLLRRLKSGHTAADLPVRAESNGPDNAPSIIPSPGREKAVAQPPACDNIGPTMSSARKKPKPEKKDERLGVSPQKGDLPVNRNGLPVLDPRDDLDHLLLSREAEDRLDRKPPPNNPPKQKHHQRSSTNHQGRKRHYNRHGIVILTDQDEMAERLDAPAGSESAGGQARSVSPDGFDECGLKDKNGIPILDQCNDLGRLFRAPPDDTETDQDLADAMARSIAHDARTLIKKKTDGHFPTRKLTLKEQLKRYPHPQRELDLHGATAVQAQQRTDIFVRNASADGLFTLRLIVGKGLHSEAGAVLPDVVEEHLVRLKREGLVLAYRWDKGIKRKSGAVLAYLVPPF